MKTVIMAGGRGTRISELFPDIPKPLIPIEGIPVLERELISLRDQGFKDVQKGAPSYYRGVEMEMNLLPKVKIEIVVSLVPYPQ